MSANSNAHSHVEGIYRLFHDGDADPVNIGNDGEFTVKQLADLVVGLVGSESRIVSEALPEDDPKQRRPDLTRARDTLGWTPKIPLEEGLQRTVEYFRQAIDA